MTANGPLSGLDLSVVETPEAVLVVVDADPGDWVARFERAGGFPAREWANNMVEAYRERWTAPQASGPPSRPESDH